ncbi:amino acid permease, partial [Gregarina niphandrodes]
SIHIVGVGEALKLLLVVTGIAVVGLILSLGGSIANFDGANLRTSSAEFLNVWSSIPWATWFFLAIEGVPLAAEEALVPERDVPRGLCVSWMVLFGFGLSTTICITGSMGEVDASISDSPLVDSVPTRTLASIVNVVGLFGLLASFFSVIYGYSRLIFALARARFVPKLLETTNERHSPWVALIVPGVVGYALTFVASGSDLLQAAVCAAAISYTLVLTSFIVLRITQPQLRRPYRVKCGLAWASLSLILSLVILAAAFISNWVVSVAVLGLFALAALYYAFYARHKVDKENQTVITTVHRHNLTGHNLPTDDLTTDDLTTDDRYTYTCHHTTSHHTTSHHTTSHHTISHHTTSHTTSYLSVDNSNISELITPPETTANCLDDIKHHLAYHEPIHGSSTSTSSTSLCTIPVH